MEIDSPGVIAKARAAAVFRPDPRSPDVIRATMEADARRIAGPVARLVSALPAGSDPGRTQRG